MLQRGRFLESHELVIETIEVLTKGDLAILEEKRPELKPLQKLRDSHHLLARLIATGLRPMSAVAARSGYSISRISMHMKDPGFLELVEYYRGLITNGFKVEMEEYAALATANMIKSERMLSDKLDEADENGEFLPTRDLIAISRDAADRFGYGKKSSKDLNVNVDFASQLEKTIARSKTIDAVARPVSVRDVGSPSLAPASEAPSRSVPIPPRRRSLA